eukprot:scaffold26698_cov137-Skeletonema_menzelii.AAC.1
MAMVNSIIFYLQSSVRSPQSAVRKQTNKGAGFRAFLKVSTHSSGQNILLRWKKKQCYSRMIRT